MQAGTGQEGALDSACGVRGPAAEAGARPGGGAVWREDHSVGSARADPAGRRLTAVRRAYGWKLRMITVAPSLSYPSTLQSAGHPATRPTDSTLRLNRETPWYPPCVTHPPRHPPTPASKSARRTNPPFPASCARVTPSLRKEHPALQEVQKTCPERPIGPLPPRRHPRVDTITFTRIGGPNIGRA